jgi:hypothetical protein
MMFYVKKESKLVRAVSCRILPYALISAFVLPSVSSQAGELAVSRFDQDSEGWLIIDNGNPNPVWIADGDGGYIHSVDVRVEVARWFAPPMFLGDKSAAYGGILEFDLKQSSREYQVHSFDIEIIAVDGRRLRYETSGNPLATWTHYVVPLHASPDWRLDTLGDRPATAEEFREIFSQIELLTIRAEYSEVDNVQYSLDNVIMSGPIYPSSDFGAGTDGWYLIGDATSRVPEWRSEQGNPPPCILATDNQDGFGVWFSAPRTYLGDQSGAYGCVLSFDLRQETDREQYETWEVLLIGADMSLVGEGGPNPRTSWTTYRLRLSETGDWRLGGSGGRAPTREEFLAVLSDLQSLQITGEFSSRRDRVRLDNVSFGETCGCARSPAWRCDGDVDGDGQVNPVDAGLVQSAFCTGEDCSDDSLCQYDVDCDGQINPVDAGIVQALFGACNPPREVCQ